MRGLLRVGLFKRHFSGHNLRFSSSLPVSDLNIPKVYDPASTEKTSLKKWEKVKQHHRREEENANNPVFRMVLPPPNVTGKLHLGHFLTIAVEDTLARWKLMTGASVEWIPGFDHAGIATQSVVHRKLSKQSTPLQATSNLRSSLESFATQNLSHIRNQLKTTGALLDWEKTYYTLDPSHSSVVSEAFIQLFESGLIKRSKGIVNWSCALQTTVADIEVDSLDFTKKISLRVTNYKDPVDFGVMYFIAYPVLNSTDKTSLVVATSRPETMFGDVALAVHPDDSRFSSFIGSQVISPLTGNTLPVIADPRVKPDFGSGIVKITPAHDKLDFLIGSDKNLEALDTFTPCGLLNEKCQDFAKLPRFTARSKIINYLSGKGALIDEKPYQGSVSVCSRSGDVIEPKLMPHWFLTTQFLSDKLLKAMDDKSFLIVPENHARSLAHKLAESQDWCLSRQISWGHPIPAYFHPSHPQTWVAARSPSEAASKLTQQLGEAIPSSQIIQDGDVLDTWFSSALIPLAISGWPDSDNFKEISLMETGHDILLFWVWRMTILTLALVNRFPFRHVLLHGIVTDQYGRKMSKSRGNVIDPLHIINGISYKELIEEAEKSFASGELDEVEYNLRKVSLQRNHSEGFPTCGTDALRMTLLSQNIFDQEINLDLTYLGNCKRFSNKLWQALRFLKIHSTSVSSKSSPSVTLDGRENKEDIVCKWLLSCLYEFNKSSQAALNQAKFHIYADSVRKFFYRELCDTYIELIKASLRSGQDISKLISIMSYAFQTGVIIAHPLIPFVTEEIWGYLRNDKPDCLLEQEWPSAKELHHFYDPELMESMTRSIQLTTEIRGVKTRAGWASKMVPNVYVEVENKLEGKVKPLEGYIESLAGCKLAFGRHPKSERGQYGTYLVDVEGYIARIHIPVLDQAKTENLMKIEKLKLKLMKLQQQYNNMSFQQNAPDAAKEKLKKKVDNLILQINQATKSQTTQPKNSSS